MTNGKGKSKSKESKRSKIKSSSKVKQRQSERIKELPPLPSKEFREKDPDWQWLNENVTSQHKARSLADQYGIPIGKQSVQTFRLQIYRAMQHKVKVSKKDVDRVEVVETPDQTLITVTDKIAGREIIVADVNPNPVTEVSVEDMGTILAIRGKTPMGKTQETIVEIIPELGEQVDKIEKIETPVYLKEGVAWNNKPIGEPDKAYLDLKGFHRDLKREQDIPVRERSLNKKGEGQIRFYDEYIDKQLIPFYRSNNRKVTSQIIPIEMFSDRERVPKTEWVAESGEKMGSLIDQGKIEKSVLTNEDKFRTLKGNQLQTKVNYNNGKFAGLYYQNAKAKNQLPTCYYADFMRVDPDPIGMYQAWILQQYANPDMKLFDEDGKETPLDHQLATRGLAGSIIDTKAFRRNDIVRSSIKDAFGDSSLVWLPKGGSPRDLSVSDQMVRACGLLIKRTVDMEVRNPDFTISFPEFKIREFKEGTPKLVFNAIGDPVIEPLDSDTLLQVSMQKLKMESIVIQNLLEALYQQNWISYPRASITKADKEPIRIKNPVTGKIYGKGEGIEAEVFVNDSVKGFKGTLHERQLMSLIVKSMIAYDQGKPFKITGEWVLKSGELAEKSSRQNYIVIAGDPVKYTADQLDISVGDRGVREDDLVGSLIEQDVATPSTRTAMLEELKNAGVLSRRGERLVVDRRGYYMAALDDFYTKNDFERSYQLKNKLADASVSEMQDLVVNFDWINKNSDRYNKIKDYIFTEGNLLIEAESDLAYLEREGKPEQIT